MDTDSVRAPSGQALAVPVEPASGLAPSGFDPSRFTPGPWEWVAEDASMAILGPTGFGGNSVLCMTICKSCVGRAADKGRWEWDRCYAPSAANARLIAAAPQLCEAALDTVEALRLLRGGLSDDRHVCKVIDAHLDLLETALAAAIATEAQRAETENTGSVHEGASRRDRPISGHIGSE